jgi:hypothetical protein
MNVLSLAVLGATFAGLAVIRNSANQNATPPLLNDAAEDEEAEENLLALPPMPELLNPPKPSRIDMNNTPLTETENTQTESTSTTSFTVGTVERARYDPSLVVQEALQTLKTVGQRLSVESFQRQLEPSTDTVAQRETLLNELKKILLSSTLFIDSAVSFRFDFEATLYQTDFETFIIYIYKVLQQLINRGLLRV